MEVGVIFAHKVTGLIPHRLWRPQRVRVCPIVRVFQPSLYDCHIECICCRGGSALEFQGVE